MRGFTLCLLLMVINAVNCDDGINCDNGESNVGNNITDFQRDFRNKMKVLLFLSLTIRSLLQCISRIFMTVMIIFTA